MAITTLTPNAKEESTYIITVSFKDENDDPATPKVGLNWTLTDTYGVIINERAGEVITPSSTINIVLTGEDLAIPSSGSRRRVITIEGAYDSSLGSNLPLKDQAKFEIDQLIAVD